jgi:hypothetical protein
VAALPEDGAQKADSTAIWLPAGVWGGWGVSEAVEGFVTTLPSMSGVPMVCTRLDGNMLFNRVLKQCAFWRGYLKRRIRRIAPGRTADLRCGTRVALTAGRGQRGSRRGDAHDHLHPEGVFFGRAGRQTLNRM